MRLLGVLLLSCACGSTSMTTDAGGGSCVDTPKTPANLVKNSGFECGAASPSEWGAIFGTVTFPGGEGRTGRAAKLVADASGGRLAYQLDVVTAPSAKTYCARAWFRGTAPFMRVSLATAANVFSSNEQVTSGWKQAQYARANALKDDKVSLLVEMQLGRSDGQNAKPGDVLFVDDVDVWESASGQCDER